MSDDRTGPPPDEHTQRQLEGGYKILRFLGKSSLAALATGGLSSVASELFDLLVSDPTAKRRDRFLVELGRRIESLEKAGKLSLADLIDNQEAAALLIRATQAAVRSSGEQKLIALRETAAKGLVGAASGASGPAQVVVGMLDRMTEHHIVRLVWERQIHHQPKLSEYSDPLNVDAHRSKFYGHPVSLDPETLTDPVQIYSPGDLKLYVERADNLAFQLAHADLVAMGLFQPVLRREKEQVGRNVVTRVTPQITGYQISQLGQTVCAFLAEDDPE